MPPISSYESRLSSQESLRAKFYLQLLGFASSLFAFSMPLKASESRSAFWSLSFLHRYRILNPTFLSCFKIRVTMFVLFRRFWSRVWGEKLRTSSLHQFIFFVRDESADFASLFILCRSKLRVLFSVSVARILVQPRSLKFRRTRNAKKANTISVNMYLRVMTLLLHALFICLFIF